MNAKKSREDAIKAADAQIQEVKKVITDAVSKGGLQTDYIDIQLLDGTAAWLKDNGYKVMHDFGKLKISWT